MINATIRRWIYLALALGGVTIGALTAGYSAAGTDPAWLNVITAVYAFLVGPTGLLATLNVSSEADTPSA